MCNMISYEEYLEVYHRRYNNGFTAYDYNKWFTDHLTGEFRIGDNWYPCIPLSDKCEWPFDDYFITVITRNGTWLPLRTKDKFRMIENKKGTI